MLILNRTRGTMLADRAVIAESTWSRMKGLLGRQELHPGEGLVLEPCQSVHTVGMQFPIDVLHLDAQGVVRRVLHAVPPNRLGPMVWAGKSVVELPSGIAALSGTVEGDQLEITAAATGRMAA